MASKEEWDDFNRLLLLLEADGELETVKTWREWHPLQGVATLLFAVFVALAIRVGFGEHLFAYALPSNGRYGTWKARSGANKPLPATVCNRARPAAFHRRHKR